MPLGKLHVICMRGLGGNVRRHFTLKFVFYSANDADQKLRWLVEFGHFARDAFVTACTSNAWVKSNAWVLVALELHQLRL